MIRPPWYFLVLMAALAGPGAGAAARQTSLDPSAWGGDARFLAAAMDSIHPRPHRLLDRQAMDSAAAELERRLPAMRYDQAVAGFSKLIATLGDGHSRLDQFELPSHGRPTLAALPGPGFRKAFMIEGEVFADGLWIVRAKATDAGLLGAHVIAIDGRPVAEAVRALEAIIPADNPMWALRVVPALLRSPGYVAASGLANDPDASLRLTLIDASGRRREDVVPAERPEPVMAWLDADAGVRIPLPLTRSLTGPFAFTDLADSLRTIFVRPREIVNPPGGEPMAAFVDRLFAHADSLGSRRLILDLRGNGGGNNYLNQPLVHALIRRPRLDRAGALFVIIDRGTFSAAAGLAFDLERETHALFVGEPTGAAPNSPGDPVDVTLPASGLIVRVSSVFWQGSDPRDPRRFLAPRLPASPTWADWVGHRDPALTVIEAYRPAADEADVPPNMHWGNPAQLKAVPPAIAW